MLLITFLDEMKGFIAFFHIFPYFWSLADVADLRQQSIGR